MRRLGLNDALNITFNQVVNRLSEAKKEFKSVRSAEVAKNNRYKVLKKLDEIKGLGFRLS